MKFRSQLASALAGAILFYSAEAFAEAAPASQTVAASSAIPDDLNLLVGKKVIVGRMPLCVPNTYTANLGYTGKSAVVAGFKPNQTLNNLSMSRLPPAMRAQMMDIKKGGTLVFQFEDGTKLDTCVPQGVNALSANLELAPGQTISAPATAAALVSSAPARTTTPQQCPATVVKVGSGNSLGHILVDSLTTSEFQRQVDQVNHGGVGKHYLDIQVRNDSKKPIKAFEFGTVYSDKMGDEASSATYVSQNGKPIQAGSVYKASAMDRAEWTQSGAGEVSVYISRIRFGDDSYWQDNGSRSCALRANVK